MSAVQCSRSGERKSGMKRVLQEGSDHFGKMGFIKRISERQGGVTWQNTYSTYLQRYAGREKHMELKQHRASA